MTIQPIRTAAAWRGEEMAARSDWMHRFTEDEVAEIEQALANAKQRGLTLDDIEKDTFSLPRFRAVAERALELLENGPGLFLMRGLPVLRHTVDESRMMYWGLGKHLGTAVSQSRKGDVLGDVRDLDIFNTGLGRGYQSRREQAFHTDSCDVVGLLVIRTAREGGLSKIVSTATVHNVMLAERPDLVELLYQPFTMYTPDRGPEPWSQPVFSVEQGHFSARAAGLYIQMAQRDFPDLPRVTQEQWEAIRLYQEIPNRPGLHFTMMFQPGDLQLLNNHVTLHGRTGFEDEPDMDKKRHLLRLWLSVPNSRPLSPQLETFWRDVRPGAVRGGYPSQSGRIVYESLVS